MSHRRLITLAFLLLELSPFVLFEKKNSCPLCNSNTLWNISMVLGRNVEQDQTTSRTRMTTLPFFLLALSPSFIFDSDKPLISCPLCKTKTL